MNYACVHLGIHFQHWEKNPWASWAAEGFNLHQFHSLKKIKKLWPWNLSIYHKPKPSVTNLLIACACCDFPLIAVWPIWVLQFSDFNTIMLLYTSVCILPLLVVCILYLSLHFTPGQWLQSAVCLWMLSNFPSLQAPW